MRKRQLNNRQHHEDERLHDDDDYVEAGPHEVQRQLPQANQRNENEDQLARLQVAEQAQTER